MSVTPTTDTLIVVLDFEGLDMKYGSECLEIIDVFTQGCIVSSVLLRRIHS
jgi:hypothetical protein